MKSKVSETVMHFDDGEVKLNADMSPRKLMATARRIDMLLTPVRIKVIRDLLKMVAER